MSENLQIFGKKIKLVTMIFDFRMVLNLIEVDIANYTKAGFQGFLISFMVNLISFMVSFMDRA